VAFWRVGSHCSILRYYDWGAFSSSFAFCAGEENGSSWRTDQAQTGGMTAKLSKRSPLRPGYWIQDHFVDGFLHPPCAHPSMTSLSWGNPVGSLRISQCTSSSPATVWSSPAVPIWSKLFRLCSDNTPGIAACLSESAQVWTHVLMTTRYSHGICSISSD